VMEMKRNWTVPVYDPDLEVGTRLERALTTVGRERKRQLALQQQGRFTYTLSDDGMTDFERLACIVEEVGEVGRNVLARAGLATDGDTDDAALRKELSQIAALAVAWMERL
jgi:NTP pyrophosphatase (non-canonical NTP hydrolase)